MFFQYKLTLNRVTNAQMTNVLPFYLIFSEPYNTKPILCAALTNVRGKCTPIDLVRVETKSQVSKSKQNVRLRPAQIVKCFR